MDRFVLLSPCGHHKILVLLGQRYEAEARPFPLIERYGVQLYISGHDHDLQHIKRVGTSYVTSGAAANTREVRPTDGTLFAARLCWPQGPEHQAGDPLRPGLALQPGHDSHASSYRPAAAAIGSTPFVNRSPMPRLR